MQNRQLRARRRAGRIQSPTASFSIATAALAALTGMARGGTDYWVGLGGSGNWSDTGNWSGGVPGNSTNMMFQGSTGLSSIADTSLSTFSFASLAFNPGAGAFTISGGTLSFTAASSASVADNSSSTETISNGLTLSGSRTVLANSGALDLTGAVNGTSGVVFYGTPGGVADLSAAEGFTGNATINGGTVIDDFSGTTATTNNLIGTTNALTFGGGTFQVKGFSGGVNDQLTSSTSRMTLNAGASSVMVSNSGGGSTLLELQDGITRNVGSTVDFSLPTGTQSSTNGVYLTVSSGATSVQGGILTTGSTNRIAFATVNGGTTWATLSPTSAPFNVAGLSTYTIGSNTNYNSSSNNVDVQTGNTPTGTGVVSTLRFNTAGIGLTLSSLSGSLAVDGGILATPTGIGATITGGTLTPLATATAPELPVIDYSSLTINSAIANGNTNAAVLTVSGTGATTLAGTNTYTGQSYLNAGTVSISSNANLGAVGTGATVNMNGATLQATSSFSLDNGGLTPRAVVLGNNGGTFDVTGTNSLTISGVVSNLVTTFAASSLTKTDSGTLTLTGNNSYVGQTIIKGGTLKIGAGGSISHSSQIIVGDSVADNSAQLDVTTSGLSLGSGQTLAGHGTIDGNVTTVSGSILSPGNSIGTTTYKGNLTLASGTALNYDFSSSGGNALASDEILMSGGGVLTLPSAGSVALNENFGSSLGVGTYVLADYTGGSLSSAQPVSSAFDFSGVAPAGDRASIITADDQIQLVIGPVGPQIFLSSGAAGQTLPQLIDSAMTAGNAAHAGQFTPGSGGSNILTVSAYPSSVNGINSSAAGDTKDYLKEAGFSPSDAEEVYLLKLDNNGTYLDPTVAGNTAAIAAIISDINFADDAAFGLSATGGAQLASTIDPGLLASNIGTGYDIELTIPSAYLDTLTAGSPTEYNFGFDFSNYVDNSAGVEAVTVTDLAVVPEPAALGLIGLAAVGVLRRRRSPKT